jgi:hypothetical protein
MLQTSPDNSQQPLKAHSQNSWSSSSSDDELPIGEVLAKAAKAAKTRLILSPPPLGGRRWPKRGLTPECEARLAEARAMPQLQMSPPPIARACTVEQHEQAGVGPAIALSPPSIVPPSCVHHGDTAMGEGGEIIMVDKRFYNAGTSYPGSHQQLLAAVKQHWIVKVEEAQQTTPEGQSLSRTMQLVMERAGVTQSQQETLEPKMRVWLKPENRGRIMAAAQDAARVAVNGAELGPPADFPLMEAALDQLRKDKNARGSMVTSMWINMTARWLANELHPGKATRLFRASQGWFAGFTCS